MRRRPTCKYTYFKRQSFRIGLGLVNADTPVKLVMEADLLVRDLIVSGQLHPVHTQVGMHDTRLIDVFGIYLG